MDTVAHFGVTKNMTSQYKILCSEQYCKHQVQHPDGT